MTTLPPRARDLCKSQSQGVRLTELAHLDSFVIPPGRRLLAVPGSGDHRTAAAVRRLWAMIVMSKWKALAFKPR